MTLQKPPLPDASSAMADKSILGMNERVHMIFNRIVDRYLTSGSAVGSKAIATDLDHMLSSASIRSIMGELESAGLLFQPHTSAGRIPTQSGLRIFVNGLLEIGDLLHEVLNLRRLDTVLAGRREVAELRFMVGVRILRP